METILSKRVFYEAPKGSIILDTNGKEWEFTDEPWLLPFDMVDPRSEPCRNLKSPTGEIEELTYTYQCGEEPCLAREEFMIIPELKVIR